MAGTLWCGRLCSHTAWVITKNELKAVWNRKSLGLFRRTISLSSIVPELGLKFNRLLHGIALTGVAALGIRRRSP